MKVPPDFKMAIYYFVFVGGITQLLASFFQMRSNTGHPIGEYVETFIAHAIVGVATIGAIMAATLIGEQVVEDTRKNWLGYSAIFFTFIVLCFGTFAVAHHIPGIGWRVTQIIEPMWEDD